MTINAIDIKVWEADKVPIKCRTLDISADRFCYSFQIDRSQSRQNGTLSLHLTIRGF